MHQQKAVSGEHSVFVALQDTREEHAGSLRDGEETPAALHFATANACSAMRQRMLATATANG